MNTKHSNKVYSDILNSKLIRHLDIYKAKLWEAMNPPKVTNYSRIITAMAYICDKEVTVFQSNLSHNPTIHSSQDAITAAQVAWRAEREAKAAGRHWVVILMACKRQELNLSYPLDTEQWECTCISLFVRQKLDCRTAQEVSHHEVTWKNSNHDRYSLISQWFCRLRKPLSSCIFKSSLLWKQWLEACELPWFSTRPFLFSIVKLR